MDQQNYASNKAKQIARSLTTLKSVNDYGKNVTDHKKMGQQKCQPIELMRDCFAT